jgi:hypothetical protein
MTDSTAIITLMRFKSRMNESKSSIILLTFLFLPLRIFNININTLLSFFSTTTTTTTATTIKISPLSVTNRDRPVCLLITNGFLWLSVALWRVRLFENVFLGQNYNVLLLNIVDIRLSIGVMQGTRVLFTYLF